MKTYHLGPAEKKAIAVKIHKGPLDSDNPVICKLVFHGVRSLTLLGKNDDDYSFNLSEFYKTLTDRNLVYTYVYSPNAEF